MLSSASAIKYGTTRSSKIVSVNLDNQATIIGTLAKKSSGTEE